MVEHTHVEDYYIGQTARNEVRDNYYNATVFIPTTYADSKETAFKNILNTWARYQSNISNFVIGLDAAMHENQYMEVLSHVRSKIPEATVIWQDSPKMNEYVDLLSEITDLPLFQIENGQKKGFNVYRGIGLDLAFDLNLSQYQNFEPSAFIMHDSDIVTFNDKMLLNLLAAAVHENYEATFIKANYSRFTQFRGEFRPAGRVTRLLFNPLAEIIGHREIFKDAKGFMDYLQEFGYALSGEMMIRGGPEGHRFKESWEIATGWGLETQTLSLLYDKLKNQELSVAQVKLPTYDHKHSDESHNDIYSGLNRMAIEISKHLIMAASYRSFGDEFYNDPKFYQKKLTPSVVDDIVKNYVRQAHIVIESKIDQISRIRNPKLSYGKNLQQELMETNLPGINYSQWATKGIFPIGYDVDAEMWRVNTFSGSILNAVKELKTMEDSALTLPPWQHIDPHCDLRYRLADIVISDMETYS